MQKEKATPECILDKCEENAGMMQVVLNTISSMVKDEYKEKAAELISELELRMFYENYLYDCHGSFLEEPVTCVVDFDQLKQIGSYTQDYIKAASYIFQQW